MRDFGALSSSPSISGPQPRRRCFLVFHRDSASTTDLERFVWGQQVFQMTFFHVRAAFWESLPADGMASSWLRDRRSKLTFSTHFCAPTVSHCHAPETILCASHLKEGKKVTQISILGSGKGKQAILGHKKLSFFSFRTHVTTSDRNGQFWDSICTGLLRFLQSSFFFSPACPSYSEFCRNPPPPQNTEKVGKERAAHI